MLTIRRKQIEVFEQNARHRTARLMLDEIAKSSPHAVVGLNSAELDFRLDNAVTKAALYRFTVQEDVEAFIRLSLVVGPLFDEYPPFQKILSEYDEQTRLFALLSYALPEDWSNAAQFDIVKRYRKDAVWPQDVRLVLLDMRHVELYFCHALHPDVWRLAKMTPLTSVEETHAYVRRLGCASHQTAHAIVDWNDTFLGACIATDDGEAIRMSYWVVRPGWGRGIGGQALKQLMRLYEGRKRVLHIDPQNLPSRQLADCCGFLQVGPSEFESKHG